MVVLFRREILNANGWFHHWKHTKTTAIQISRCASGVLKKADFNYYKSFQFLLFLSLPTPVPSLSHYLYHHLSSTVKSASFSHIISFPQLGQPISWPTVPPSLSTPTVLLSPSSSTIFPRPNPMKRCISYYQSLMNLDLKMEYCPETNLSYEGEKKFWQRNLVRSSWVPDCNLHEHTHH